MAPSVTSTRTSAPTFTSGEGGEKTLISDVTKEMVAAEAAFVVAPSSAFTPTSGGGAVSVGSVSAADAAVAVASSAARRRTHERKEDMCSAVGGMAVDKKR